jgi:WD40 repeat protein
MASCSDDTSLKLWTDTKGAVPVHFGRVSRTDSRSNIGSPLAHATSADRCTGKLGWKLEQTLTGHHSRTVFSVDWSAADVIASGAGDNSICIYALQQPEQQQEAEAGGGSTSGNAAVSPASNHVSVHPDSTASAAVGAAANGTAAAPTSDSHQYGTATQEAASEPKQQQAQQQQAQQGAQLSFQLLTQRTDAHAADVNCVRWAPMDHSLLASASDDHQIKLWQLRF